MTFKSFTTFFKSKKIPIDWSNGVTYVAIWKGILIYGLLLSLIITPIICRYNFLKSMRSYKVTIAKISSAKLGGVDGPDYYIDYSYFVDKEFTKNSTAVTTKDLNKLKIQSGDVRQFIWIKHSLNEPENSVIIYDSFPQKADIDKQFKIN
jgi:hypothetical protein